MARTHLTWGIGFCDGTGEHVTATFAEKPVIWRRPSAESKAVPADNADVKQVSLRAAAGLFIHHCW